jgi:hypothetical protein
MVVCIEDAKQSNAKPCWAAGGGRRAPPLFFVVLKKKVLSVSLNLYRRPIERTARVKNPPNYILAPGWAAGRRRRRSGAPAFRRSGAPVLWLSRTCTCGYLGHVLCFWRHGYVINDNFVAHATFVQVATKLHVRWILQAFTFWFYNVGVIL